MSTELIEAWGFRVDDLAGYISGGHEHGVELTEGVDGGPVTRRMCLNVEHYYARSCRDGQFVPRYKADVSSERLGEDAVRIIIAPYGEWHVETVVTYRLLPERTVEARYVFSFGADYVGFEALISNYFHQPTEPYLHLGGRWVQPRLSEREHRFWVRGPVDAASIPELYGAGDGINDVPLPIDPLPYDHPVMITPIGDTDWSVVNMVERKMCPSLSANRIWRAHDFSIVGHDVGKGQTVTCRAWMAYVELESMDEALSLLRELAKGGG